MGDGNSQQSSYSSAYPISSYPFDSPDFGTKHWKQAVFRWKAKNLRT